MKSLSETELNRMLVDWNATARPFPLDRCLHQFLEEQCERTPDNIAVVFEGRQLTYRELNHAANALAWRLKRLNVQVDDIVGVFLERSLEMAVSLLGILRAGAAYLPLDPEHPDKRIAAIIDDAKVSIVLTSAGLSPRLSPLETDAVCLDVQTLLESADGESSCESDATPDTLCYVLYTSGSTGTPKGVMIPHRAICNHMLWMIDSYGFGEDDHVLQKTPFGFDASVWEFYAPLLVGAKLIVAKPGGHRDTRYMINTINEHRVRVLQLVPSVLRLLVNDPLFSTCESLRNLFCGGEPLSSKLTRRVLDCLKLDVHNLYGPTECCIDATSFLCTPHIAQQIVPIGRPIANTQIYILDENRKPVPLGEAGEIYIGGTCLARGYVNRPELNAEKFIPNPFRDHPSARLYRTGDKARYLSDGNIEFIGRFDFQVKFHGYRIELGEIESALEGHEAVQQAVVLLREEEPDDAYLAAYVTIDAEVQPTTIELKENLRQILPRHMVPSAIVVLDSIPLTTNGKVDRSALPVPILEGDSADREYVAPETDLEAALARIWAEVLHRPKVSVADDFFQLGGDSLGIMKIELQVEEELNIHVPQDTMFEITTVRSLAAALESSDLKKMDRVQVSSKDTAVASFAQESFYAFALAFRNQPIFNQMEVVRFTKPVNLVAIASAINGVIERHETLRTSIRSRNKQVVQVVEPPFACELPVSAVGAVTKEELQEIVQKEVQKPFDLTTGPVIRARLLKREEDDHILILTLPHIAWDGWSADVLIDDLLRLYRTHCLGETPALTAPRFRYIDYAVWQRQRRNRGEFEDNRRYWVQALNGDPPTILLPVDGRRRAVARWWGGRETHVLPGDLMHSLKELAAQQHASLYMMLLAPFQLLMHEYTGKTDIVTGASTLGRSVSGAERVVGCFINFVGLRTRLDGDPTFLELLSRVRTTAIGAFAHQDLPFGQALEPLVPKDAIVRGVVPPVWFELHDVRSGWDVIHQDLGVERLDFSRGISEAELAVEIDETADNLVCHFEYKTTLFSQNTIEAMIARYHALLVEIVRNPRQRISRFRLS